MRILLAIANVIASLVIYVIFISIFFTLFFCSNKFLIGPLPMLYRVIALYALWFLLYFIIELIKNKNSLGLTYKAILLQAGGIVCYVVYMVIFILIIDHYLLKTRTEILLFTNVFFLIRLPEAIGLGNNPFFIFQWGKKLDIAAFVRSGNVHGLEKACQSLSAKDKSLLSQALNSMFLVSGGWFTISPNLNKNVSNILLDYGADPDMPDQYWNTPLDYAILGRNRGAAALLLEHHANPNTLLTHKRTPLQRAITNNRKDIVKLLLDYGADTNMTGMNGLTPLVLAIIRRNYELVELLLEHGANPDGPGLHKLTPLQMAITYKRDEIVQLLLEHGADIHALNYKGNTALHTAADVGNVSTIQLLVKHGADINARNYDGQTPLALALEPATWLRGLFVNAGRRRVAVFLRELQAQ